MLGLHRLLRRWHARKGRLVVLPSVHSAQLDNRRDLYVYVPAAPAPGDTGYPVIYMQDGQNLFDPAVSFAGTWGVDEALSWASRRGLDARAPRVSGRLYLDVGMREGQQTVALGRRLRDLLLAKGYEAGRDFRWVEDKDGVHHESAWGSRFREALPFLLREPAA